MFNKTNISRKNTIPFLFAFLFFKTVEISQQKQNQLSPNSINLYKNKIDASFQKNV